MISKQSTLIEIFLADHLQPILKIFLSIIILNYFELQTNKKIKIKSEIISEILYSDVKYFHSILT